MTLYKNKYRIESARLQNYDYGSNGAYFVTICTKNRIQYFGEIRRDAKSCVSSLSPKPDIPSSSIYNSLPFQKMYLSEIGQSAYDCWLKIPKHFPFVKLDVFVIMPNHIHGIIIIDKEDKELHVFHGKNKFGPQSRNLASIIRGYKIGVTKFANQNGNDFTMIV